MSLKAKIQGATGNAEYTQRTCGLLTQEELAITKLDATAVLARIASGQLTAVETVTAFGKRAAIAHQLTACLTDFFLDEGIEQARALDEYFKREAKVVGPLHGLPISIKDMFPVRGRWGSAGFLSSVEVSPDDCDMTKILRELGAVFYVKTNQPQAIMHLESQSCYGRTLNPHNTNLSPGGSSGGESALIAMKGSCMGIGSDAGGSIRGPCAFTGLYGIRPSCKTIPMGACWYQNGHDGILGASGPMCSSSRDMRLLVEAVLNAKPWLLDPSLVPLPLTVPDINQTKLRVGIMIHDGVVLPHPPMLRAMKLAKAKLEASREVEVVDYAPFRHKEGYDIIRTLYFEDGGETVRRCLKEGGEDMLPLTEWVISPPHTKNHDVVQTWEVRTHRARNRSSASGSKQGCDVVLCPPFSGTASRHDTAKYWGYTAIWNLLDYPGAVFPTGLVADPALDPANPSFTPMSLDDVYNHSLFQRHIIGAPVNLQVVSPRFNDGLVLAAQDVIERIMKSES
ncbi:amidase signature domain-containing protein [Melanogaster broomeanus]|nr:amidase signature domain-containing protein [Melanogaster broomeanus]